VHRISGRRVIPFPVTDDASLIMSTMQQYGAKDLIVLTRTGADSLFLPRESDRVAILMAGYSKFFRLINTGPGYEIFSFADPSLSPEALRKFDWKSLVSLPEGG